MNEKNAMVLNKLDKTQYYNFLVNALGIKIFIENNGTKFFRKKPRGKNYFKFLGSQIKESEIIKKYYYEEEDYSKKNFRDDNGNKYSAYEFFDSLEERLITVLILSSFDIDKVGKYDDAIDLEFGLELIKKISVKKYYFILGTGVNLDSGLKVNIGKWDTLVDSIRNEVRNIKNIVIPKLPVTKPPLNPYKVKLRDELTDFEESICNTNYISPQILKIENERKYYQAIYNNMYSINYNTSFFDVRHNSSLVDTKLFQIARIINKQGKGSEVLTFNYDDVLENILNKNFGVSYQSVYYKKRYEPKWDVHIIHSHGYYPYGENSKPRGIVLSTYEYLKSYKTMRSYAASLLNNQLNNTNLLIGNSLADYEEQKVFFYHFKNNPSAWHFLLTKKSPSIHKWMDVYKIKYFMRMGVIPVFFDDFKDICTFLKGI